MIDVRYFIEGLRHLITELRLLIKKRRHLMMVFRSLI
jgi:hypothetical protein